MTDECRFPYAKQESHRWGVCETHQQDAALCTHAAAALQADVRRLVEANEHWHTRIEQMKQQVEAYEAHVRELEGQLALKRNDE